MSRKGIWKIVSSGTFFSREPLNIETFNSRLRKYRELKVKADSETLVDCIRANRRIQAQSTQEPSRDKYDFLGIYTPVSNTEREAQLWQFLQEHKTIAFSEEKVAREYLSNHPISLNTKEMFEMTIGNFKCGLARGDPNSGVFRITLNALLERKDYHNSIKLIDKTYNSPEFLSHTKKQISKYFSLIAGSGLLISCMEYVFLPLAPLGFWFTMNIAAITLLIWGNLKVHAPLSFYRIKWRPYNSLIYRYIHRNELQLINKIIIHFEEHSEVNIRNFHHSKVRKTPDLSTMAYQNYTLNIPDYAPARFSSTSDYENHENIKLNKFFRHELQKRKMVINELEDELMFLDFWLSHGEKYTWVEPDQDPAEIIELDIKHN